MVAPIPVSHLRRYQQAESVIRPALQRALMHRSSAEQRNPLGLPTLDALHRGLSLSSDTELGTFILYVAPLIRSMAMQAAERQAMVEPIKLRFVDLEQCLRRLDELDPECVRIIELRYFAGLTVRQAALVLGISVADILNRLRFAKAWLQARLRWTP